MYYEIVVDTLTSACGSHGGTACIISGYPVHRVEVGHRASHGAHLVRPMSAFATLAMANWGLANVVDAPPGSHVDLHLPVSVADLVVEAMPDTASSDALVAFTAGLSALRRRGIGLRISNHFGAELSLRVEASELALHAMDLHAAAEDELDVFGV